MFAMCSRFYEKKNDLKKHYLTRDRINAKNYFFKALFKKTNGNFSLRKCYRCDMLITSSFEEVQHNFIQHYQKGGELPLENRHIK